jgi:gallate decarboxylase subunit D
MFASTATTYMPGYFCEKCVKPKSL